jgi:D-lactate dehydrogenase
MGRNSSSQKLFARFLARRLNPTNTEGTRNISNGKTGLTFPGVMGNQVAKGTQVRGNSVAATATRALPELRSIVVPEVKVDLYGAVSAVLNQNAVEEGVYKNVDGHRFEDGRYKAFTDEVSQFIPKERMYSDAVRTFAYGTDASFYRLNPKMVVKVHNEAEVTRILQIAARTSVPVTFRAAGTSLSGQAITDSVLLKISHAGKNFRNYEVHVRLQRLGVGCF